MGFYQTWYEHRHCGDLVWIAYGQINQFLTELPARDTSDFSFPDIILSKYQWIFTKLGMCIDIIEI